MCGRSLTRLRICEIGHVNLSCHDSGLPVLKTSSYWIWDQWSREHRSLASFGVEASLAYYLSERSVIFKFLWTWLLLPFRHQRQGWCPAFEVETSLIPWFCSDLLPASSRNLTFWTLSRKQMAQLKPDSEVINSMSIPQLEELFRRIVQTWTII